MKNNIDDINGWLYHRIRMCIWKQWKLPRTKKRNLIKMGIHEYYANMAAKIGGNVKVIAEEPYYRYIPKNGLKLSTKVSMTVSDQFKMVKMIHLKL